MYLLTELTSIDSSSGVNAKDDVLCPPSRPEVLHVPARKEKGQMKKKNIMK